MRSSRTCGAAPVLVAVLLALAVACASPITGCGDARGSATAGDPGSTAPSTPSSLPPSTTTVPVTSPATATTEGLISSTTSSLATITTIGEDAMAAVVRVTDGDTIVVRILGGSISGTAAGREEELRLIGIDSPETGEDFAQEATDALQDLLAGKEVVLAIDAESRDQYGRLLAYVFCGDNMDVLANAELLRRGVATVYTVPPNVKYVDILQRAQDEAKAAEVGMWTAAAASPLKLAGLKYDPPGDDTLDLNQEYIVFQVLATTSLAGYAVEDESGKRFDFPDRVFQKGQTLTLHSGRGSNTQSDLYWGASGSAIWNNDGDTVKVLDPQGRIVESYAY